MVSTLLHDNETVLLHLQTQRYYTLNATGSQIWRGLSAGLCAAEISTQLATVYDVTPAEAQQLTLALLQELSAEALVQPVVNPTVAT